MGVIYHCSGDLTIEDFVAANAGFLNTPDEIRKWRYTLIDLVAVELMKINYADVSRVVDQNKTIAAKAVSGVLLAVASPKDLGFGLARITPDGKLTTLYRFCSQPKCSDGWLPTGIVQAATGAFTE